MKERINILIKVYGKGGHGAQPNLAVDPVVTLSYIIQTVRTLIPDVRFLRFDSGTGFNIIAHEGSLLIETDMDSSERIKEIAENIALSQNCRCETE